MEYVHARAAYERWVEEAQLLFEEQRRIIISFIWSANEWIQKATDGNLPRSDTMDPRILEGRKAFCVKHARRYLFLARQAWGNLAQMEKLKPKKGKTDGKPLATETTLARLLEAELRIL